MMDRSKAEAIVEELAPHLQNAFALQDWCLHFFVDRLGDEIHAQYGECTADPAYHQAAITVDSEQIVDEEKLKEVLRHEMIHVLHAPFVTYKRAVDHLLTLEQKDVLDEVWRLAQEHTEHMIERMFDSGIYVNLDDMVERSQWDE